MLEMLHIDSDLAQAFDGRIQILSWRSVHATNLRESHERAARHRERLGEPFATISIVAYPIPFPDAETRAAASESAKKTGVLQNASATVIEGEGFWASAARAAIAGIYMVSSTRMPNRCFATNEEAAVWIGPFVEIPQARFETIVALANEVRRQHLAV